MLAHLKGTGMMHTSRLRLFAASFALAALGAVADGAATATIPVCLAPADSLIWKTATASPLPVFLPWPDGAASALIEAVANGATLFSTNVTDTSASSVELPLASPTKAAEERVVSLTLTFRDSSDAEVSTLSARVGLVRGATKTTTATARLVPDEDSKAWTTTRDKTAVVPVEGATTLNGLAQTGLTPPDWLLCRLREGLNQFTATIDGETTSADILRIPQATTLLVQ